MPELGEEMELDNVEMPEEELVMPDLDDEIKLEDMEMPDMPDLPDMPVDELSLGEEFSIDGLDEAIQSETEIEMAGTLDTDELNIDELDFGDTVSGTGASEKIQDGIGDIGDIDIPDGMEDIGDIGAVGNDGDEKADEDDDSLDDVLTMLDDDAELAEINDMLKKSDSKEPIKDDMMDMLHQMADDEAAFVNAGEEGLDDEDDGGVPIPTLPKAVASPEPEEEIAEEKENGDKKKDKKESKKKKKKEKETEQAEESVKKEPGKIGKFFNMLTEDLVPEPTEEELAAEKEAKEAKKKENLTKKEEEKLAKEEEKKVKAEEKAAADKAKKEAADQKKKEKQAAKEAKIAAKKAKEAAKGPIKRIPPKKKMAAAVFGATVGGAIILSTNILSTQGYLSKARKAFYDHDYKTVYQATFDMELDDTKDMGLIRARSEVMLMLQRRYDSYNNYMKLRMEKEALDALLQGVATYDYMNAVAEKYEVSAEFEEVRAKIFGTLAEKYNVDETRARELINMVDAYSYTMELEGIIARKNN